MERVTVTASALRQILEALNGPDYLIRELQVTRKLDAEGLSSKPNPINILISEYNTAFEAENEKKG